MNTRKKYHSPEHKVHEEKPLTAEAKALKEIDRLLSRLRNALANKRAMEFEYNARYEY
jgi:hypothetical protein